MNLASDAAQKLYSSVPDRIKAGEIDALIIVADPD
jgi:protein required for attachment to host cells